MLRPRLLSVAAAALALAPALVPAAADANLPKFRMSISGTMTTSGDVTVTDCLVEQPAPPPSDGSVESLFAETPEPAPITKTGTAKRTVRFRTIRPAIIHAQRMSTGGVAITLANDRRPIKASATITAQSTLADRETPLGCGDPSLSPKPECGTATLKFDIGVGGRGGVAPDLSKNSHKNDPVLGGCPTTVGMNGFPSFAGGVGEAEVSAATLQRRRTIVLEGGRKGGDREQRRTVIAKGSYELRYTIRLTRVQ